MLDTILTVGIMVRNNSSDIIGTKVVKMLNCEVSVNDWLYI